MNRASVAGLFALACLSGCAAKQQTAASGQFWQEPVLPHPELLETWKPVPGFVTATGDEKADQRHALAQREQASGEIGSVSHAAGKVDHSYDIYNPPKTAKEAAGLAETLAAKKDAEELAAADAKREHQQVQLTAIEAECRYEVNTNGGPGYRASHAYGLGGAIAGVFVEAAMNGAIAKQHFAECVQARALAVDAGLH